MMNPSSSKIAREDIKAYGSALRSLRTAIEKGVDSTNSEVLCASQLLALYEVGERSDVERSLIMQLLGGRGHSSYAWHVAGCSKIIAHRQPSSIKTDFDKTLLNANTVPTIFYAAATNTHCYLEQKEWIELYADIAKESSGLSARCRVALEVRAQAVRYGLRFGL